MNDYGFHAAPLGERILDFIAVCARTTAIRVKAWCLGTTVVEYCGDAYAVTKSEVLWLWEMP